MPHLHACVSPQIDIAAVYTQPDRPAGRGRKLAQSPVKQAAVEFGIPVEQPETLKSPDVRARLQALRLDLLIVVAYGLILPRKVLAIPRLGCWNVHASLLPRWRGAAPIQRAILAGDRESGVCVMQMEAGLDTGPVLLEHRTPIDDADTGGSLHDTLAELGARALRETLDAVLAGRPLAAHAQAAEGVTYAHKIEKSEARIDWNEAASAIERKVRAFNPWPIAEAPVDGEILRIWSAIALPRSVPASPGAVIAANRLGLDIACGEGALRIVEVQRAGGRRMAIGEHLNARPGLARTS